MKKPFPRLQDFATTLLRSVRHWLATAGQAPACPAPSLALHSRIGAAASGSRTPPPDHTATPFAPSS